MIFVQRCSHDLSSREEEKKQVNRGKAHLIQSSFITFIIRKQIKNLCVSCVYLLLTFASYSNFSSRRRRRRRCRHRGSPCPVHLHNQHGIQKQRLQCATYMNYSSLGYNFVWLRVWPRNVLSFTYFGYIVTVHQNRNAIETRHLLLPTSPLHRHKSTPQLFD